MHIKKRSTKNIISVLLIIAMAFTLTALTACNSAEDEVEQEITVNVKIVGANNQVLSERDVTMLNVPSELTVYAAIATACDIEEIEFAYDDDFHIINQIGIYGTPEEAVATVPTEVDEEGNVTEIDDGSMWYWGYKVNGVEEKGTSAKEKKLSDGNAILVEWLKDMGQ